MGSSENGPFFRSFLSWVNGQDMNFVSLGESLPLQSNHSVLHHLANYHNLIWTGTRATASKGGWKLRRFFVQTELTNDSKPRESFIEETIMYLCSLLTKPDLSCRNVVQSWGIRATIIRCATILVGCNNQTPLCIKLLNETLARFKREGA